MSTKYGLPLTSPSKQNILLAMKDDGVVIGWYPIATTTFNGSETTFALSDVTVPIKSVTVDTGVGNNKFQFMAAVFSVKTRWDTQPWASVNLLQPGQGYYRWWSLPTEGARLNHGGGIVMNALKFQNMVQPGASAPAAPGAPSVTTPIAVTWGASIAYEMINGGCAFFDIPWVTLFTQNSNAVPIRITTTSVPAAIGGHTPFAASTLGQPVATPNGPVYDTLRIIRLIEPDLLTPGLYVFTFTITTEANTTALVTLNLTIA